MVEQGTLNPKVEGSNPSRPIVKSPGNGAFPLIADCRAWRRGQHTGQQDGVGGRSKVRDATLETRLLPQGWGAHLAALAIQALDIDVSQHSSLDITRLSTEDLEALIAILQKYEPDAAQLAESGGLRFGASPVRAAHSRQRSERPVAVS